MDAEKAARALPIAAGTTSLFIVATSSIGSYVSTIGAGMACPEWPHCPELSNPLVLAEFVHRLFGGLTILSLISTLVLAIASRRVNRPALALARKLTIVLAIVLTVQVFWGAFVVFTVLNPVIVAIHQGLAQFVFGLSTSVTFLSLLDRMSGGA